MTKEEWLYKNAIQVDCDLNDGKRPEYSEVSGDGMLPVVLVNNGPFTAAAITYSENEYREFTRPDDDRPRQMFIAEIDKLKQVSNLK